MAEFLTAKGIEAEFERILGHAEQRLVLISPFLRLSATNCDRLLDADHRRVEIILVYGTADLKSDQRGLIEQIDGLILLYLNNLHAKAYANEHACIVCSMNLYESRETANREMGVLLTDRDDPAAFKEAWAEINSIVRAADTEKIPGPKGITGACVRCGAEIDFEPAEPLCASCYSTWAVFENLDYEEKYCHYCGKPTPVSKRKPLCGECFALL